MTRVKLSELRGLGERYPGLFEDFLMRGQVQGDSVVVERAVFEDLNRRYFGDGFNLGTAVHLVLGPIAKAADAVAGTKLAECGGCGARELKLNAATAPKAK